MMRNHIYRYKTRCVKMRHQPSRLHPCPEVRVFWSCLYQCKKGVYLGNAEQKPPDILNRIPPGYPIKVWQLKCLPAAQAASSGHVLETEGVSVVGRLLAVFGHSCNDTVVFDVVGIVGLDISGDAIQSTLKRFLRRRVHHARLLEVSSYISNELLRRLRKGISGSLGPNGCKLTYCGASSGTHEMNVILLRFPSPPAVSYSTSNTAYRPPMPSSPRLFLLLALSSFCWNLE